MATTLHRRSRPGRYRPLMAGISEAERTAALKARQRVVRRIEQLLAAGRTDAAVEFASPILALIDGAPATGTMADLLDRLAMVDAREDVARLEYRRNPVQHRTAYLAHIRAATREMLAVGRALRLEETPPC